ncbi:MAG: aminotransferase class I/II-fold pyridoxal phosphate-dependent enzyme [Clostridia bacterium]|nr:aminotransferase class I/II-fold pyridoxal phosphate-dependent enzyme [Clostridia bacterium]
MSKVLFDSLQKYKNLKRSSFHTPGHKGKAIKNADFFSLDYTELPFTDSLYESRGIIKQAEENLSELYGSKRSIFSCGGNTLCMQAMIRLCAPNGGKILCDRVAHRAAISAFALLGLDAVWLERQIDQTTGITKRISAEDIEKKLQEDSEIKAVYVTSPDYYGILQDIKSISEVCKKYSVPLIVDNAHGSHLKFLGMGLHPLEQGATMSADSAHKTLPVLTGGAWLHINDEKFCEDAKNAMALFGSTSPSYSVMASMDMCADWLRTRGEAEYKNLAEFVSDVRKFAKSSGLYVPDESVSDPCRITLGVWKIGLTGEEFRDFLYKFKIEPEFCDENYVVLIPSPFNTQIDRIRLKMAVKKAKQIAKKERRIKSFLPNLPQKSMSIRTAVMSAKKCVDVQEALGKVAAEIACPCPSGVPIVMPGEVIGKDEIDALTNYGVFKINVVESN